MRLSRNLRECETLLPTLHSLLTLLSRFLLAQLHLDMISQQRTRNAVHAALEKLPSSLDATYRDVMERISKQSEVDADLAQKVLRWITYSKEPLKAKALQHTVAIIPSIKTLNDGDLTDVDDLVSVCAGIVTIDRESGIVRLVHYTTQIYLEEQLMDVKVDIASGCLTYLGLEAFCEACDCQGGNKLLEDRLAEYPFVSYAAVYWSDHVRGNLEDDLKDACFGVFKRQGLRDSVCQIQQLLATPWNVSNYARERSLLHIIALSGLSILCRCLLDKGVDGYQDVHL